MYKRLLEFTPVVAIKCCKNNNGKMSKSIIDIMTKVCYIKTVQRTKTKMHKTKIVVV